MSLKPESFEQPDAEPFVHLTLLSETSNETARPEGFNLKPMPELPAGYKERAVSGLITSVVEDFNHTAHEPDALALFRSNAMFRVLKVHRLVDASAESRSLFGALYRQAEADAANTRSSILGDLLDRYEGESPTTAHPTIQVVNGFERQTQNNRAREQAIQMRRGIIVFLDRFGG